MILRRFVLLGLIMRCSLVSPISHNDLRRQKYPFGLLGNDHEILTEDDLAINTCTTVPAPFGSAMFGHYWKCFRTKEVSTSCEKMGYDSSLRVDLYYGNIIARAEKEQHDYGFRQLKPINDCRGDVSDITRIMKNQKYVCFSGQFFGYEKESDNEDRHHFKWTYDKVKTKMGCVAYFGNAECTLAYWQEDGCEAITKKYGNFQKRRTKN